MIGLGLRLAGVAAGIWGLAFAQAPAGGARTAVIYVAAEHPDGRRYEGLGAADFELRLDDERHPVLAVSTGPHPISLALVIDVTARPGLEGRRLRQTIERLGRELTPADHVRLWTVGGGVRAGPPFSNDRRMLLEAAAPAIDPRPADLSGPSPLWDAVVEAVTALEAEPGARAIVIVSDGRATANHHGLNDAIMRASRAGVAVSAVGSVSNEILSNDTGLIALRPGRMLEALAANTGGRTRKWDALNDPPAADLVAGIVESLRHGYRLTIEPPPGDDPRLIELRVARPDLKLRARRIL